jgi:hypothetical protein
MVAGLLNILAMYDAFEGPAHIDEAPPSPVSAPSKATVVEEVGVPA